MAETQVAEVDVKSAWFSKINWTQVVSALAVLLTVGTGGKFNLTPEQQVAIVTVIALLSNSVTLIIKTWFTPTVTPASIK